MNLVCTSITGISLVVVPVSSQLGRRDLLDTQSTKMFNDIKQALK